MKYKLKFKALDDKLNLSNLSTEILLDIVAKTWQKYKREFEKERSFVETEYPFEIRKDGTFEYTFWIGDMYFTEDDYSFWVQDIFLKFQRELQGSLKARGLSVVVTEIGAYPDGAGYHGRGFATFKIESIVSTYAPLQERILDFYTENKKVTNYGVKSSLLFVDYTEDSRTFRVLMGLIVKNITKITTSSVREYPWPLSNDELKFFDGLGFELNYRFAEVTKQSIDDWFKGE